MAKQEYLIVVHDADGLDCYSEKRSASSGEAAIKYFAMDVLNFKGAGLKLFLEENHRKKMVSTMFYKRSDRYRMQDIHETLQATKIMGNTIPGYLDKYHEQPELPPIKMEPMPEQPKRASFPVKNIPISTENMENKTERDLPDWEKRVLYYARLEHRVEDDEYDYNK